LIELAIYLVGIVIDSGAFDFISTLVGGGALGAILTFALRWRKEDNRKMSEIRSQSHSELKEVVEILTDRLSLLEKTEQEREERHRVALADADTRHHDCEVNCRKLNLRVSSLQDEITNLNSQIEVMKENQQKLCAKCGIKREE
jgi:chromosome segregation ATPase